MKRLFFTLPTNEPNIQVFYKSMEMTASEVADFVAGEGDNCGASIMVPESFNMEGTYIDTHLNNAPAKSKASSISGNSFGVIFPGSSIITLVSD